MGSVSMAIANAAKEAGAQIFTNAEVFCFQIILRESLIPTLCVTKQWNYKLTSIFRKAEPLSTLNFTLQVSEVLTEDSSSVKGVSLSSMIPG